MLSKNVSSFANLLTHRAGVHNVCIHVFVPGVHTDCVSTGKSFVTQQAHKSSLGTSCVLTEEILYFLDSCHHCLNAVTSRVFCKNTMS